MSQALKKTDAGVTPEQLAALRQVVDRLAYACGRTPPPIELHSLDELISVLNSLSEYSSSRRSQRHSQLVEAHEIQEELENLERLKGRFMRNVSHELRTPLASIDGFARALLRMENPEESKAAESNPALVAPETRRHFLSIISQEAQRLGKLIEDVLDLSEVETHPPRREPELIAARALFSDALSAFNNGGKPVTVVMRLRPEPDGPPVYADHDAIVEVLNQLLSNAQKFSAGQEISLGAELVSISPNAPPTQANTSGTHTQITSATRLYVRDRGVGIPPEELDNVFEKFYRVERPGLTVPGTGVGLSIVRTLVKQNNGQVWAESELGRGSTFYILLPNKAPGV